MILALTLPVAPADELEILPQAGALPTVILDGRRINSGENLPDPIVRFCNEVIEWRFPMMGRLEAEPVDKEDLVPGKDEVDGGSGRRTYRWGTVSERIAV